MPTYCAFYRPGPAWRGELPSCEQLEEHDRYIYGLMRRGVLHLAGPYRDRDGGLAIFDASDMKAAESIIGADPAVVGGVMTPALTELEVMFERAKHRVDPPVPEGARTGI